MSAGSTRQPVRSAAAWQSAEMADPEGWTVHLSDAERAELVDAGRRAHAEGHTPKSLAAQGVRLPLLEEQARLWAGELHSGRGFLLLRSFPVDVLTEPEIELAYVAFGLQLGTPVSQDAQGSLLGHVRDEGAPRTDPSVRLYRTRARQDFHTDGADLVGLLCLQRARAGGESRVASSFAVYNHLLREHPHLLEELYRPLYWDRNDEQGPGEDPFYALAPCQDLDGVPRIFYIGWYIRDAQRHPQVPRLTEAQLEAMAFVEATANNEAFHVEMDFQPGDLQLVNNARILHAREAYEDHDDPARRRHLLRLWLIARHFRAVEDTLRKGIPTTR